MSLLAMPTTLRSGKPVTTSPSRCSTCRTYGQWLQRNATRRAGAPSRSWSETLSPVTDESTNAGAGVPSGTIVDSTAMTSTLPGEHPRCGREVADGLQLDARPGQENRRGRRHEQLAVGRPPTELDGLVDPGPFDGRLVDLDLGDRHPHA